MNRRVSTFRRYAMIACLLIIASVLFLVAPSAMAEPADNNVQVTITSFFRRNVSADGQIRCSELMEAIVTGYDGNPNDLTYEWTNVSCNADLYLYNSYNMSGIDDTSGEIEKLGQRESAGGRGFAWAAVRSKEARNYQGQIQVIVKDARGREIARDTYTNFANPNLSSDLAVIGFGLFEGEEVEIKTLLGRSVIVHITCQGASVKIDTITDVSVATITGGGRDEYKIKGIKMGKTSASVSISKGMCSFHSGQTASAEIPIYVFRKPTTSTTATTLTLAADSLDPRCKYFIGSVEGVKQDNGDIIFTDLTPNTRYQVTVRGEFTQTDGTTQYAYAYVVDTTKPIFAAEVQTYLNDVHMDMSEILDTEVELYLHETGNANAEFIPLTRTGTGIYTASVNNGEYQVYSKKAGETQPKPEANYYLEITNANASVNLKYYTVQYSCGDGSFAATENPGIQIYPIGSKVSVTDAVPHRPGYSFDGWEYHNTVYTAGNTVTNSISSAIELVACWEKNVNITVNVTIDHTFDGGFNRDEDKDEVEVYLLKQDAEGSPYIETGDVLYFDAAGVTNDDNQAIPYDITIGDKAHKYKASSETFADMPDVYSYDVTVQKSGYDADVKIKENASGDWTIDITLTFHPTNFDLAFSVKMADGIPQELWPDAVIYRIAYWNGNEWKLISQMDETHGGKRVDIDPSTGAGAGSYPVWMHEPDEVTPYYYRVWPTAFVYSDGTIVQSTRGTNGATVYYTDGNYTATLGPVSEGHQVADGLKGAYYDDITGKQVGTLDAVITLEAYDVVFDAMGGTVKGESVHTLTGQYFIPALADYTPVNGEHNFLGWYMDTAYTTPAVGQQLLTQDAYLYASWDHTLTGVIEVEGTYELDGETIAVADRDLPTSVTVILQEIAGNEAINIGRTEVPVTWNASTKTGTTGSYKFVGLSPDDNYRVVFVIPNYTASYRNAQTAGSGYNANDFTAVYTGGAISTFVNGHMDFTPEGYDQPVVVDATEIGEGFRPKNVLVEIHYKEVGIDEPFHTITQHTVAPYGIEVKMAANGLPNGNYSENVWRSAPTSNEFAYQANVSKIDNNAPATLPLTIRYDEPARWSPVNNAPTGTLYAHLIPNQYNIQYHLGAESGNVTQFDSNGHTWSFATPITYEAECAGYIFGGWYMDANFTGSPVTQIEAGYYPTGDDRTIHLYAKWTPRKDLSVMVYYKEDGTGTEIKAPTVSNNHTFGTTVDVSTLVAQIPGYTYKNSDPATTLTIQAAGNVVTHYYTKANVQYSIELYCDNVLTDTQEYTATFMDVISREFPVVYNGYALDSIENMPLTLSADENDNVIKVYYAKDVLKDGDITENPSDDDSETGGDGIPDKYQAIIQYVIENGRWSDNSTAAITEIFTLKTRNAATGEWTNTNVTLGNTIPTGMKPVTGYDATSGGWTPVPNANAAIAGNASYHYAYGRKIHVALNITVENGTSNPSATSGTHFYEYSRTRTVNVTFTPDEGYILESATINGADAFNEIKDGKYTYRRTGNVDIVVHYTKDVVGGGDDGDEPDNIPDKYQKKLVFKVVNGTWKDGTTKDIVKYVELKTGNNWDVNGSASTAGIVPTDMKPNEGYKIAEDRLWNPAVPATVSGTAEAVYTFTFYPQMAVPETLNAYYQVVHMFEQSDGSYQEMQREFPLVGVIGQSVTATPITSYANYELSLTHHPDGNAPSGVVFMPRGDKNSAPEILTLTVYYSLKRYTVEYDLNGGSGATGVDYSSKVYTHGSKDQFKAAASLHGHIFKGWKEEATGQMHAAGTTFTVDRNMKLIAVWEKQTGLSYTVNYLDLETGHSIAAQKIAGGMTFGDTVNSANERIVIPGYCFVGANPTSLTIDTHIEKNVLNLYYAVDVLDDENDDDTGDEIPDFYQKKITFKVVNGHWGDPAKTKSDIIQVVTLRDQNNNPDATNGTAEIIIPTSMMPDEKFTANGSKWDNQPVSPIRKADPNTYTFTFMRALTPFEPSGIKYIVLHFVADENNIYPSEANKQEIFAADVYSTVNATPLNIEGYTLNTLLSKTSGTLVPLTTAEDIVVLKLYYDKDVLCDGDETDDPEDQDNETTGDGIPDIYQKKVTYRIVNGVWSDNTTSDIVEIVTLRNVDGIYDINGAAELLCIPQDMKPMPNCTGGEWDVTPPQFVIGSNEEMFVYMYTLNVIIPPTGDSAKPMLWLCLMGASCLMMAVIAVQRKRNMKKH